MFLLIAGMEFGVVGRFIADHPEHDLEESLAQAAQRAGVTHALLTFLQVVSLSPATGAPEAVGPEMNGAADEFVAGPTDMHLVDFAGLIRHRSSPGDALEHFLTTVTIRIAA